MRINALKKYRYEKNKETREFFLIVCEGEKTEPNYFEGFKRDLQKHVVQLEVYGGCGNTMSLIEYAEQQNSKRLKLYGMQYDQVWLVFDKDDFPAHKFNSTITESRNRGWNCAYSNEAFELWYLLHYEFCNTGITRHQYIEKLKRYMGSYEKNDCTIYRRLKELGTQPQAIRWAKMLYALYDHRQCANEKPSTTVHLLVGELNRFM